MTKDLIVVTYPEKMAKNGVDFDNFKASIGEKFKIMGRDVDLLFLPEGIDIKVVKEGRE